MEHTRNQKRMYRIKKLEEKIVDLENISKKAISELSTANDKLKKIDHFTENLEYGQASPYVLNTISKIIKGDD